MQSLPHLIFLFFIFLFLTVTAAVTTKTDNPIAAGDRISINCGSTSATSTALSGREWLSDLHPKLSSSSIVAIQGSSSIVKGDPLIAVDPVPYNTARISRSQFSYTFQLSPGQKVIRLHFNPAISYYNGFQSFDDFFTVEAGPFTLLANFSPSITARALSVNTVAKEFCLVVQENQPNLNIIFSPSQNTYAFINGLEIISVPSTISYCYGGDIGVQVVGHHKSVIHIDNTTALEMIHRLNVKWDSVPSGDDIRGMFGMWATILKENKENKVNNNITWKISVDVGFRYLVRLHFCELGIKKMEETGHKDFILLINHMIATTGADVLRQREEDNGILWYKNYVVMVKGHKREGKRHIFISLHSKDEFADGHSPLEGFEIFKLSNHDNSLASPNPFPPTRDSSSQTTTNIILSVLGRQNAIATVLITIVCLINIIVHMLLQNWAAQSEENKPSTKAKRLCRLFSLSEIKTATVNFNDAFVIGKGGFGKVYKGLIDNEQEIVAIKRLKSNSKQGKHEFRTEIEMLSELRHLNLVSLIGYCNERREMILVYEYMPCGTLADHLYKLARKSNVSSSLSWKQRLKICIGAGRGLDYLHTGHGIIHRDVKASNILLDEKFVAKVSDFGLAKTESGSELQSQASTKLKGTFGYFDPDYFRTRKLTTKSDVYSFGVVLLEVLCGRPAVEPWVEEDKRSLTIWARDQISKGGIDQIVDPSVRGEISPDSLKAFVRVAERCLHDEPKKRPAIANIVIRLEFALKQQENAESLVPNEITSVADFFPSNDKAQQEKANSLVPNGITNVADVLPGVENARSWVPNEITNVSDAMPRAAKTQQENAKSLLPDEITSDRTILSVSTRQLTMTSSIMQNVTSPLKEQTYSKMINSGKKDGRKRIMHKLSRLLPWNAFSSIAKPSKKKDLVSISAPLSRRTGNMTLSGSALEKRIVRSSELILTPNLRIFSFSELKAATRNFSRDTVLGEGGFGLVYKGWIHEKSNAKNGSGSPIAVKKLSSESMQGFNEWQSEVNFLGKLHHPNLVKLLGYCWEDNELILVYEFMQKGSLENHLFTRGSDRQPLPWDIRLQILIGAARGLAFLHASDRKVIYRDFKPSNILLDESYHAKLSDFGLAKLGPTACHTHVSTQVMGTYGYAAPEYIATGHLYVKSDVYGFGVILVEMLTGLRAVDRNRPSKQQNLVDWIRPYLPKMNKLNMVMDPRLEGKYPPKSALQIAQLALNCLQMDPKSRPSMQEVVEALERIDSVVEKPTRHPRVHFSHLAANPRRQQHL